MNAFARLILAAGLVAGMAVPVMAQTTSHVVKHHAPVTHHVAKASPVAATTPATAPAVTSAPAPSTAPAVKPAVPAKN